MSEQKDELKIKGEIKKILDVQEGTSKAGKEWKKLDFVVVKGVGSDYPKDVCFTIFGEEKIDKFLQYNKVGDEVSVFFDVESREYNDKYFSNINAWMVKKSSDGESATPASASAPANNSSEEEVLPF